MKDSTAEELIAQNKLTKNTTLDLSGCGLTEVPTELRVCLETNFTESGSKLN